MRLQTTATEPLKQTHFYALNLIEIWSEIIVGAARGDKKLTARGDKYDTFGVPGCTLYK